MVALFGVMNVTAGVLFAIDTYEVGKRLGRIAHGQRLGFRQLPDGAWVWQFSVTAPPPPAPGALGAAPAAAADPLAASADAAEAAGQLAPPADAAAASAPAHSCCHLAGPPVLFARAAGIPFIRLRLALPESVFPAFSIANSVGRTSSLSPKAHFKSLPEFGRVLVSMFHGQRSAHYKQHAQKLQRRSGAHGATATVVAAQKWRASVASSSPKAAGGGGVSATAATSSSAPAAAAAAAPAKPEEMPPRNGRTSVPILALPLAPDTPRSAAGSDAGSGARRRPSSGRHQKRDSAGSSSARGGGGDGSNSNPLPPAMKSARSEPDLLRAAPVAAPRVSGGRRRVSLVIDTTAAAAANGEIRSPTSQQDDDAAAPLSAAMASARTPRKSGRRSVIISPDAVEVRLVSPRRGSSAEQPTLPAPRRASESGASTTSAGGAATTPRGSSARGGVSKQRNSASRRAALLVLTGDAQQQKKRPSTTAGAEDAAAASGEAANKTPRRSSGTSYRGPLGGGGGGSGGAATATTTSKRSAALLFSSGAQEQQQPSAPAGPSPEHSELLSTALVFALLRARAYVGAAELAERQRLTSLHFQGCSFRGRSFDRLVALFSAMLSFSNLPFSRAWHARARVWRLALLQSEDGHWDPSADLAVAVLAAKIRPEAVRLEEGCCGLPLPKPFRTAVLSKEHRPTVVSRAGGENNKAAAPLPFAAEEGGNPGDPFCPLSGYSADAFRWSMPPALLEAEAKAEFAFSADRVWATVRRRAAPFLLSNTYVFILCVMSCREASSVSSSR